MQKFEVLQGGRAGEPREKKKKERVSQTKHTVVEGARIEERNPPTKEKVMNIIKQIAAEENIAFASLFIEEEVVTPDDILIGLSARVEKKRARQEGLGTIWYVYTVHGEHGIQKDGRAHDSVVTIIDRMYSSTGRSEDIEQGLPVAYYEAGEWRLIPFVDKGETFQEARILDDEE